MEWVNAAEEYIASFGWGARGKSIGISRMFGEGDKASLSRGKWVASVRPRGVLSGFLAIIPTGGGATASASDGAVFIPPIAARVHPHRFRMRCAEGRLREGAIFSAYMTSRRLVLEDVLVWGDEPVWMTRPFRERWGTLMRQFVTEEFCNDLHIQHGLQIELAKYMPLCKVSMHDDRTVLEFVPDGANMKRLIYMGGRGAPTGATAAATATATTVVAAPVSAPAQQFYVQKEADMGPDVYAIYAATAAESAPKRLGLALVRTLAVSRALRTAIKSKDKLFVRAEFNKTFDKYEVLEVYEKMLAQHRNITK